MIPSEMYSLRDAIKSDESFIFATLLKSLYFGDSWFSHVDKTSFMKNYHLLIENLLAQDGMQIKIACLKEDSDVILGYSMYRGNVLHYVFVKKDWRKAGIARALVPNHISTVTHATKIGLSILKKKNLIFDPFAS